MAPNPCRRPAVAAAVAALMLPALAVACPLCGEALRGGGSAANAGDPAAGYAAAVLLMLAGIFGVFGGLGLLLGRWFAPIPLSAPA